MKPDRLIEEWTASNGRRSRVAYHRDPSGGWTRHVEERRDGSWRTVGIEEITDLEVEGELGSGDDDPDAFNVGP